jgi:hypothetical protein
LNVVWKGGDCDLHLIFNLLSFLALFVPDRFGAVFHSCFCQAGPVTLYAVPEPDCGARAGAAAPPACKDSACQWQRLDWSPVAAWVLVWFFRELLSS